MFVLIYLPPICIIVDPDTTKRIVLKTIYKPIFGNIKKDNNVIIGKNKVILTFISDNSLNGTGFKAEVKSSMFDFYKIAIFNKIYNIIFVFC